MKPITLFIFQSSDDHKCVIAALTYDIAVKHMGELSALKCDLIASEKINDMNANSLLYSIIIEQAQTRAVVIDNQILAF